MPAPAYTTCYEFKPGDRPFNEKDLVKLFAKNGVLGASFGAVLDITAGLAAEPIGAVVGLLAGAFAAEYTATSVAITEGANEWLHHRLICLGGDACAIGVVKKLPEVADLDVFDNDEYFDLTLMPQADQAFDHAVLSDGFQGVRLIRPRADLLQELGYDNDQVEPTKDMSEMTRDWLHCEAEGDFWVRMKELAPALGVV